MKTRRKLLAGLAILLAFGGTVMITSCRSNKVTPLTDGEAIVFPRISGMSLLKEEVQFPDDIEGRPALVLVAFYQRQQSDVNTWLDRIPDLEAAIPDVRVIETPTISSMRWGWFAPWIDGAMRSGIPDPVARERTITFYTNVRKFRNALDLGPKDRIYAILLDEEARVIHVEEGPLENQKLERLLDAYFDE